SAGIRKTTPSSMSFFQTLKFFMTSMRSIGEGQRRFQSSTRMFLTAGAFSAIFRALMTETADFSKKPTRALLVGTYVEASDKVEAQSLLEELAELVRTLGVPVGDSMLVHHRE